jgi:hypothetical protein
MTTIVTRRPNPAQNSLIGTPELASSERVLAAPNGG